MRSRADSTTYESRSGAWRAAWIPALAVLAVLGGAGGARAAVNLEIVDPQLEELAFGADFEAIAAWVGKRLDKVYLPRIANAPDANERARLRARREQEIVLLRNAEVRFDGRQTGFEVSIIANEFGVGTDESMYRYKEGLETHYFFMHQGKLWKYARALSDGPTFAARYTAFQNAFGVPVEVGDEPDGKGGRTIVAATWKSAGFDVRLVNRRTIYGLDLFVIEDREKAVELVALRQQAHKPGLGGVSDSLEDFLLEDPDAYGTPPKPTDDPPPDAKKGKGKTTKTR